VRSEPALPEGLNEELDQQASVIGAVHEAIRRHVRSVRSDRSGSRLGDEARRYFASEGRPRSH
jgi:hypothetical protein